LNVRFLYNFYRTYDPDTGRYLEADPIGQAGGVNAYAYALSNPLRDRNKLTGSVASPGRAQGVVPFAVKPMRL
jgi:uncharacterized protein RhaS with RHS repeats